MNDSHIKWISSRGPATSTPDVSYGYDAVGQRTSMVDGTGTSTYVYDAWGQLTSNTNGAGATVSYGYNLRGGVTSVTYPGSTGTVTRTYDHAGALVSVKDWANHTTTVNTDANENMTSLVFPNTVTAKYTFDNADQVTHVKDTAPKVGGGTATLADFTSTLDNDGKTSALTSVGTAQTNQSYSFDALDQLSAVNGSAVSFDGAGNVTRLDNGTTQSFDAAGQLAMATPSSGSATTFGYNARGDRTSATTGGVITNYAYDQGDRLTSVAAASGTSTYGYDGDGLRASSSSGGSSSSFVYGLAEGLPQILSDGSSSFVYAEDVPIEQVTGSVTSYLQSDALRSTRVISDASDAVAGAYAYSTFGVMTSHTGAAITSLGFAGQYTDPTGLQYLRARFYDPATGQFLTRDPIEAVTGAPYSYADGNPVDASDPSGMLSINPWTNVKRGARLVGAGAKRVYRGVSNGTVGVCIGADGAAIEGISVSGCVTVSKLTRPGAEFTFGSDLGTPAAGVHTGLLVSNAESPSDLGGLFGYGGGSVTVGPDVGITAGATGFIGPNSCGKLIYGGTLDVGVGADFPLPYEVHAGASKTWTLG